MFVALKPISLSGEKFFIGDTIPEDLVLPSRVDRLKATGYITDASSESGGWIPDEDETILREEHGKLLYVSEK